MTVPVLALVGPTASGKSALSMQLAQQRDIEIISLDSALIYRDMNIGTAKPTADERNQVPHHLIDIRSPEESYSAAEFVASAERLIREIRARGRTPVIVGGTMMYLRALTHGLDDLPGANPQIRERLEAQAAIDGWPALHAQLAACDPATAQRLAPNDSQRIQRALEVFELSGQPLSSFFTRSQTGHAVTVLSLEPMHRADLHARIAQRFDAMLQAGVLDEVDQLRRQYVLDVHMPSVRCVGYRQAWDYLDGHLTYKAFREAGIAATRQLAKRQLTWLRSMPGRVSFDAFTEHGMRAALDYAMAACSSEPRGKPPVSGVTG